ncbi:MAG TPA: type IV pilus assembly protein PilM [Parcubacteria group bacterium]|jgi:type IV pilus assembly protein PilM|nr:type IV pilus assembly protein PilM [Parcubacteria group bacterium]
MANFLSQITDLFAKKSGSVLGIDIGSSSIKVVQISRKNGHAILETYGELALGPYTGKGVGESVALPQEKVIEAVKDMLKEKEVNITTMSCGVAIPFASSLMAVIEMPDVSRKELEQMIPIEARKYVPVPISEVTLDWYVIPKDKNAEPLVPADPNAPKPKSTIEVLIVALHNDTINKYKNIVTNTGLDVGFFEIEIFSTMRSVLDDETKPVLVVDMGASSTKLYMVERGILRASHMVERGSYDITDELSKSLGISLTDAEYLKREKGLIGETNGIALKNVASFTLNYIFTEADRFILTYQKKYNKDVSKVILVGGGSALKGVVPFAKEILETEVLAGDPFSKVVAPAFLEQVLKETGPEFAVAVGVALRKLQEVR